MTMTKMGTNYNKATTFVRPLIGFPNYVYRNNYINCYVEIEPAIKIFLVFKNLPDTELDEAQKQCFMALDEHPDLIEKTTNKKYIIYSFLTDPEREYDISCFLSGRYSKMSESAKTTILFSQYNPNNIPIISSILWPSKEDVENLSKELGEKLEEGTEIFSKPELEKELYNEKEYVE